MKTATEAVDINAIAKTKQLTKVIESLDKIPEKTKQMIFSMSLSLRELEIIQLFNQQADDLFTLLIGITQKFNREREYNVIGYKALFDNALKLNAKLPIDKYTLIILEYAAEIYAENENIFMDMPIPDAKVNIGNEFGLIRSEMFKKLWVVINAEDKNKLKDSVILLTTYAHVYLYKTILCKCSSI